MQDYVRKKKHMVKELQLDTLDTPIGPILLIADGGRLCSLYFADCEARMLACLQRRYGAVRLVQTDHPPDFSSRLRAYFAGEYQSLDAIPVDTGGTAFQQQVWAALRTIPPGTTMTYGALQGGSRQQPLVSIVGLPIERVKPLH